MTRIVFPIMVVVTLAIVALRYLQPDETPTFELEEGYTWLYDGESLQGWRAIGGEATFEADGADIVGRFGPGENTFLRTEKTYGDFSLKLQMRWDEPGNSGVLFRAAQRDGDGRAYGYQYELDASERAWTGGIYDEARRGWLASLENNQAAREAVRLDDWNDVEIEARGAQLRTWINGVPAADIIDGLDAEGFIALQVHSGNSGVIRWRNIRLRELPGMAVPGPALMASDQWRHDGLGGLAFQPAELSAEPDSASAWLSPRRQFSDALLSFDLPVCDEDTVLRVRYDEENDSASYAQLRLSATAAQASVVTAGTSTVYDPVALEAAPRHRVTITLKGSQVVLTVGEQDALRIANDDLPSRGRLWFAPGACDGRFAVENFAWFALREGSEEPLFYQTLDTQPAPVLSPDEALEAFRIAPGFEIELVAAEPLVEEPVAMAWDASGRLYVVEMRGYMRDAYGTDSDAPVGQVVRLTDDDGDGRMDRSEVFLAGLVNPRAVAVVNEGVLIGEPPNLLLCAVPTRDALCKSPVRVGAYGADVASANVEHMENGLRLGLDNWLYNSKSDRQVRLVDGKLQERTGLFRGQWGITRDDVGRWLYNHNSTWVQADYFAAEDILVPGGSAVYAGLGENLTNPAKVYSVRVNPGVNRAYLDRTLREDGRLNNATGVSGLVAYRGDQFPAQFRGDVFVPESAGNVVAQFGLSDSGMVMRAEQRLYDDPQWGQRDFLGSTDERFRPVDAMNGPDGALYIIDMYRGIIQDDHFLTEELREQIFQRKLDEPIGNGRIWRVRHVDGAPRRSAPDLAAADDARLLAALSSDNGWERDTAQRLLLARKDAGADKVRAALVALATGEQTVPALHALWTLNGRGELTRDTVLAVVRIDDVHRQVNALRAGAETLQEADLIALAGRWERAPAAVRVQLALTLAHHSDSEAVRSTLVDLATAGYENTFLRQAVIRAVAGHELAFLAQWLERDTGLAQSDGATAALAGLAGNAYRTLRGDLTVDDQDNTALLPLLELAASRDGASAWQQLAMLKGFAALAVEEGFTPARFEQPPAIFADSGIDETNPLWDARLNARVAFTWPGDELAMGIKPLSPGQLQLMAQGQAFYAQCAACHGEKGLGIEGLAPPLAGAAWVTGPPEWLGRIILQGATGPMEIKGVTWEGVMPPHGHLEALDDTTLAGLMTYLRRSWGNKADPVSVEQATAIRTASAGRANPWTVAELEAVPFDRGYGRFLGKYSVSFLNITIEEKPEGLFISAPLYGSGVMTPITDTVFLAEAGGESVKMEFILDESGRASQILLHRKGEKIPVSRVPD